MKHVAIITNIPAPYRVDFFDYLHKNYTEYRFTIIYSSRNEDNRNWKIEQEKMRNSVFLESKTIKIKKRYDNYYLHIPTGVSKTLDKIKPDVVVGSEYNPTIIQALYYCRRKNIPFVSWTDGTLFSERNRNFVQKFLRRHVISKAEAYIASSTKSKEAQIYYGADEELYPPDSSWYDNPVDIEDIKLSNLTWEGYTADSFGVPMAILWADDGAGNEYQANIVLKTDEGEISLDDADVLAILESVKPSK